MAQSITAFSDFTAEDYPRYEVDLQNHVVFDTKFKREVCAKQKRGGAAYYRMVTEGGTANHILAASIFGPDVENDLEVEIDFNPQDFNKDYDFDFNEGTVVRRSTGYAMRLLAPNGWAHYKLQNNEGHRIRVTPTEIRSYTAGDRKEWSVAPPFGAKTLPQFPTLAFTADGRVWRIVSNAPIIRPEEVKPRMEPAFGKVFYLTSKSGKVHRIFPDSIGGIFR